jgi:hypothetical protein
MHDNIQTAWHVDKIGDIVPNEMEIIPPGEVGDVLDAARHQIVDHHDLVSFSDESVAQMGPNEASATSY